MIAGFLLAFLRGLDPGKSLKIANMVGWQNIRKMDALSGIEDWPSTLKMVNDRSRVLNSLHIQNNGWHFHTKEKIFYGPSDRNR